MALRAAQAVLAAAALTGCAAAGSPSNATPTSDPDVLLMCQGVEVPARALQEPRSATELPEDVVAAFEHPSSPIGGPLSDWLIVVENSDHVVVMRKLDPPTDHGAGDIREYEIVSISASPGAMPLTSPWGVDVSSDCTPMIDFESRSLTEAHLTLDPEVLPESGDERIALLVTESACNSGGRATDRVELVELVETESTVEVVIGVRPHEDGMARTCISNPPTPFTVDLEEPLGDRLIMNAAVLPQREITVSEGPRP